MTNINPNDDILKVNQNIIKGKKLNKENKVVAETKQVEASALSALSAYGKANITFKGQQKNNLFDDFKQRLLSSGDDGGYVFSEKLIADIMSVLTEKNLPLAEKLCFGRDENGKYLFNDKEKIDFILFAVDIADVSFDESKVEEDKKLDKIDSEFVEKLCFAKGKDGEDLFPDKGCVDSIIEAGEKLPKSFLEKLCFGENEKGQPFLSDKESLISILPFINKKNIEIVEKMFFEADFNKDNVCTSEKTKVSIIAKMDLYNYPIVDRLYFAKDKEGNDLVEDKSKINLVLSAVNFLSKNLDEAMSLIDLFETGELSLEVMALILNRKISLTEYKAAEKVISKEKLVSLSQEDIVFYVKNSALYQKKDISEIPKNMRTEVLQNVVAQNSDFIVNNEEIKKDFPLVPLTKDEYCDFLKKLVSFIKEENKVPLFKDDEGLKFLLNSLVDSLFDVSDEEIDSLLIENGDNNSNKVVSNNKKFDKAINDFISLSPKILSKDSEKNLECVKKTFKVMRKIVNNPQYANLEENDKKILLLASLFKNTEGTAKKSAINAFFTTQKFKLSKEELNTLYSLIVNSDWLIQLSETKKDEQEKKLKSIVFDMYYDDLFKMQKILTESELDINGDLKLKELYEDKINLAEELVLGLKSTHPLLPVTKFPSASRIKEAITVVNDDYSTNLSGVYQDEKGMVIIKFNEVENDTWEKIGFPKGAISSGIKSDSNNYMFSEKFDTGNIKFFVHALARKEYIRNFDVFEFLDSDSLLSVSYAERPEDKYRFYREQGLILNTDARFVYGGGYNNISSGCKKTIEDFKSDYAYEGCSKYKERKFVSDLIKQGLNLSDEEYCDFVKNNANKSFSEIEPKEVREKLIKTLSLINSKDRSRNRNYNEIFLSNPEIMGVFAYPFENRFEEIKDFMVNQKQFLKDCALEKDVPFVIFGD